MNFKRIDEINFSGKKALVRVDYNVPLDSNLKVVDESRILSSLPTINKILEDEILPQTYDISTKIMELLEYQMMAVVDKLPQEQLNLLLEKQGKDNEKQSFK